MTEKLIQLGVEVAIDQKDIADLNTLEKRLKALMDTYKVYIDMVSSGQVPMNSKIIFGDNEYTRKQLEREIQGTKRVIDEANKVMGSDKSFGEYFKKYNENLSIQRNNMELYKKLEDKNTEEAKRLLKDARNAQDRNRRIRRNMVGVFDFKAYEKEWNKSRDHRDNYNAGKRQLSAEKQAAKDAASTWSALYKEREAITKGLGKLSDASTKYATDAKKRLEAINSEMSDIVNKWSGNKDFDRAKASVENKAASSNILSGLKGQHNDEQRTLLSIMSDKRNRIEHLKYQEQSKKLTREERIELRELIKEHHKLKKAVKDTQDSLGDGWGNKFGANIKSHLHWMISGELVDRLYEIPNAIKDISVEFDNLERKIAQNIELSGDFEHNSAKLKETARDLTYSSLQLANAHGMKIDETMEMMQIMSRRFKDPTELKYYTDLAMTLSKLDFVTPAVAAESLESVILSFNLNARETKDFVNEFSVATHTMRINGQDLLESLQRSAPVFKQWGIKTSEAVAMVSTLSTTLGREGKYIGTAITGMFSRLLNDKNINLFDRIGISMTKANGEMKTGMEFLKEYLVHYDKLDEASKKKELKDMFGTYRLVPGTSLMESFDLLSNTIKSIEEKASDATTAQLESMQIESHESKINRFNNTVQFLAFLIGDALAPTVTSILEIITDLIIRLIEWDRENILLIKTLVHMIGVIGAYIISVKTINQVTGASHSLLWLSNFLISEQANKVEKAEKANKKWGDSFITLTKKLGTFALRLATTLGVLYAEYYIMTKSMELIESGEVKRKAYDYIELKGGLQNLDPNDPKDVAILKAINAEDNYHTSKAGLALRTQAANESNDMNYYSARSSLGRETSVDSLAKAVRDGERKSQNAWNEVAIAFSPEEDWDTKTSLLAENFREKFKGILSNKDKPFEEKPSGTNSSPDEYESEENKKFDKGTKMVLDAKTSKYKTDEEIAKKRFDSAVKDIDYEEELLGKTPRTIMDRMNLRANRKKELLDQYALINADIEALNNKLNNLKGKGDDDEAINDKGETTTTAKLRATYSKALDELRKLAAENEETRKEIKRSIRKSCEVAYDKQVEEEKKRNKTAKKLTLLSVDNKRNAWNDATKNNVELEYERQNNAILVKD